MEPNPGALVPRPQHYRIVRPLFSFTRCYRVYGPDDQLFLWVEQPWFRWRSELVLYADEQGLQPLLVVKSRRFAALRLEHDVFDAASGTLLGTLQNRGLWTLARDAWDVLGPDGAPAGELVEEGFALLRRFLRFLPGSHRLDLGGVTVAWLEQSFRFFRREFELTLEPGADVEPRFAVACALVAVLADLRRERSE